MVFEAGMVDIWAYISASKNVTIQLFKDISYTSNKETYEPNPKPVFFFLCKSVLCFKLISGNV